MVTHYSELQREEENVELMLASSYFPPRCMKPKLMTVELSLLSRCQTSSPTDS